MVVWYGMYVCIHVCILYNNTPAYESIIYILLFLYFSLTLHDANKLRTIINIASNNLAMSVANSGHLFAIFAASAGLSPAANLSERLNGITQVRYFNLCSYIRKYRVSPRIIFKCGGLPIFK